MRQMVSTTEIIPLLLIFDFFSLGTPILLQRALLAGIYSRDFGQGVCFVLELLAWLP